jgi:hypothetical protein
VVSIPFCGQTYSDRSLNANAQRCVGFYPMRSPAPGDPNRVVLYPTPGYIEVLDLALQADPYSVLSDLPVRGLFEINGTLYAVVGDVLLRVTGAFTVVGISGSFAVTYLGSLSTPSGRVSIVCNTAELVIGDGQYGYTYDLTTGAFAGVPLSGGFTAAGVTNFTFQDGYALGAVNGSRRVVQSDLLAGGVYGAQAFADVTSFPDDLTAVFSDQLQLYVFGPKVTEVRFNAGVTPFAFEKVQGVLIQAGCASPHTVCKVGQTILWLASDAAGKAYVAALEGYNPRPVSTPPINEAIERYATVSDAHAFTYREADNQFYVITFPAAGATWAYDVRQQMWHERSVAGGADLPTCYAAWLGQHVVGADDGKLYVMSQDVSNYRRVETVGGLGTPTVSYPGPDAAQTRVRTCQHLRADGKPFFVHELEIEFETGVGLTGDPNSGLPATTADPLASLEVSRDGGHTWHGVGTRTLGKSGQYKHRVVWRKLGRFLKSMTLRLTVSDPVRTYVLGANARITAGTK